VCSPALWGVVKGGAHKTDLKGALEVSSKAAGTHLGRKGLGTLQGAILPVTSGMTRTGAGAGRWVRPLGNPIGIL
jgi:hypothetical protein